MDDLVRPGMVAAADALDMDMDTDVRYTHNN